MIFSYHGLPEQTIKQADVEDVCELGDCCEQITAQNRCCYRAQCIATTRLIAQALNWNEDKYSIAFQSRFGGQPWIQPYLDEHMIELLNRGIKRVAVATPSFVSDCLETIHEIGIEYHDQFMQAGGDKFHLIPNLNDEPAWFDAVFEIARRQLCPPA